MWWNHWGWVNGTGAVASTLQEGGQIRGLHIVEGTTHNRVKNFVYCSTSKHHYLCGVFV